MTKENHIIDTQLPLELDFKSLKAQGLAYIQKNGSTAWTNLNPSDPGVTILEQLCYAFTELGYCANFPMKDILTQTNGALQLDNQFYKPKNILTITPVTIHDYIKLVFDRIDVVKNAVFIPFTTSYAFVQGIYEVFLLLDDTKKKTTQSIAAFESTAIFDTFSLLNFHRNLGELFLMPKILTKKTYLITGKLVLESGYHYADVLPKMIQNIQQYIFPNIVQTGFDVLKKEGEGTNDIFNGPELKNGWITNAGILPKKNTVQPFEITKVIHDTEGVSAISNVTFYYQNENVSEATCSEKEILTFDFTQSLSQQQPLQIHSEIAPHNSYVNITLLEELGNMQQLSDKVNTVASVVIEPALPQGTYRDIANYYAIQHTFPEVYKVGPNAVNQNTPDYQVAQSRQLKGYLNVFDQMLSIQFAQLANIDKLFSFQNSITGSPTDLEKYNATKTKEQKANPKYPAPFEVFSPTYFYQSLYGSVPNIEPLLLDYDIFNYGPVLESADTLKRKKWTLYQEDPYNAYMYGLLTAIEDDTINLNRRNALLNHLLARHGESPLVIDTLTYGTTYSGDVLKDRVIIKSLYLQNLGILSYNKTKAYNVIASSVITSELTMITPEVLQHTIQETDVSKLSKSLRKLRNILRTGNHRETIVNTKLIETTQKITKQQCIDYTTVILKMQLLLALEQLYTNYLQTYHDFEFFYQKGFYLKSQSLSQLESLKKSIALWLITERKGLITIETNILLQSANFTIVIKIETDPLDGRYTYYKTNGPLSYADSMQITSSFETMTFSDLQTMVQNTSQWTLTSQPSEPIENSFTPLGNSGGFYTVELAWGHLFSTTLNHSIFNQTLLLYFPNFVASLTAKTFKQRLSYYLENQLPICVTTQTTYMDAFAMQQLIPLFSNWHNALLYNGTTNSFDTELAQNTAGELMQFLDKIHKNASHD